MIYFFIVSFNLILVKECANGRSNPPPPVLDAPAVERDNSGMKFYDGLQDKAKELLCKRHHPAEQCRQSHHSQQKHTKQAEKSGWKEDAHDVVTGVGIAEVVRFAATRHLGLAVASLAVDAIAHAAIEEGGSSDHPSSNQHKHSNHQGIDPKRLEQLDWLIRSDPHLKQNPEDAEKVRQCVMERINNHTVKPGNSINVNECKAQEL